MAIGGGGSIAEEGNNQEVKDRFGVNKEEECRRVGLVRGAAVAELVN